MFCILRFAHTPSPFFLSDLPVWGGSARSGSSRIDPIFSTILFFLDLYVFSRDSDGELLSRRRKTPIGEDCLRRGLRLHDFFDSAWSRPVASALRTYAPPQMGRFRAAHGSIAGPSSLRLYPVGMAPGSPRRFAASWFTLPDKSKSPSAVTCAAVPHFWAGSLVTPQSGHFGWRGLFIR